VSAHYVRTAPAAVFARAAAIDDRIYIKNRGPDAVLLASGLVSTDFLQLVRYGIRAANDPIVRDSLKVVDGLIKYDSPVGPVWYRYNEDGYGEHDGGAPFNGVGRGRPWPLLAGERGHYAVMAGEDARPYLRVMTGTAGRGGLMPEQVWDSAPVPHLGLAPGRPSGSTMPLVRAHAEFIKLLASVKRGAPVDRPDAVWRRYAGVRPAYPERAHWSRRAPIGRIAPGHSLRLLLDAPAVVVWSADGRTPAGEVLTHPSGFGAQAAELPTRGLARGAEVRFTFRHPSTGGRGGADYTVRVD
jgi:glucoamylase